MTEGRWLGRLQSALLWLALSTLAAVGVGWIAHKIGILPVAAKPLMRPLLVIAGFGETHPAPPGLRRSQIHAALPVPVDAAAQLPPPSPFKWRGHRR